MNKNEKIRVIALAILRQADHVFVTEYMNPTTDKPYYRPYYRASTQHGKFP